MNFALQADDMDRTLDPDSVGSTSPIVDILTSLEELDAADTDEDAASSSSSNRADSGASASTSSSTGSSSSAKGDSSSSSAGGEAEAGRKGPARSSSARGRSALRKYIEGFDQNAMIETARVVSAEGAALVERQTTALFGDIKALTKQMQVRRHTTVSLPLIVWMCDHCQTCVLEAWFQD
jgi:hypothetical protein